MDDKYLLNKLLLWAKLFHKGKKVFAKKKGKYYMFGTKKNYSMLNKPMAIFLAIGKLPSIKN